MNSDASQSENLAGLFSSFDVGPCYSAPAECASVAPRSFGAATENRATTIPASLTSWEALFGDESYGESESGMKISKRSALTCAAVYRAVQRIAGDVAKLPLHLYRREAKGGRARDIEHPSYALLRRRPNSQQTAFTFKETIVSHVLLHGNGYAWIERDAAGRAIALWLLDPTTTWPVRYNSVLWYAYQKDNNKPGRIRAEDMLHLRGLGDELSGWSIITLAAESLGVSLAARKYGAKFFKNGARASGVLMTPGSMSKEAAKNLLKDFDKKQASTENVGRTMLLEEGAKYQSNTITQDEAQFLETREFENREIAVWFGCPPHFVGDTTHTSRSSLEEENQSYLDGGLDLHLVRLETEADAKLLTEEQQQRDTHYWEFNRDALLKTNLEARYRSYSTGVQIGIINRNEVRTRENMDPMGPEGDIFLVPTNLMPASQLGSAAANDIASEPGGGTPENPPKANGRPTGSTKNSKRSSPQRQQGDTPENTNPKRERGTPSTDLPPPPAPSPVSAETIDQREAIRGVLLDVATRMAKRLAIHGRKALKETPANQQSLSEWQQHLRKKHFGTLLEAFEPVAKLVAPLHTDGHSAARNASDMATYLLRSAEPTRDDFETAVPIELADIFCPLQK